MDHTCLNLVSIILGGAGLFTVLTGFNVPQARMSYFGENPYQIKRDSIANVMTWLFTALALAGLLIQVIAEVAGDAIPERSYTTASYVRVAVGTTVVAAALVWSLTALGCFLARRSWQPVVLRMHRDTVERARFAVDHGGYFAEHLAELGQFAQAQNAETRNRDVAQVQESIAQMEDLLELPPISDLEGRLRRLESFYRAS